VSQMASTNPADITVNREQREMRIRWQDGHESVYPFDLLRKECPCALCNDQRSRAATQVTSLAVLSGPVVRVGEVQAKDVTPVGRYAVNFVWSDGHDSGIYAFTYLRELCPCPACRAAQGSGGSRE
jgi:DUF971 family protein